MKGLIIFNEELLSYCLQKDCHAWHSHGTVNASPMIWMLFDYAFAGVIICNRSEFWATVIKEKWLKSIQIRKMYKRNVWLVYAAIL